MTQSNQDVFRKSQSILFAIIRLKEKIDVERWRKNFDSYFTLLSGLGMLTVEYNIEMMNNIRTIRTMQQHSAWVPTSDESKIIHMETFFNILQRKVAELANLEKKIKSILNTEWRKAEYVEKNLPGLKSLYDKAFFLADKGGIPYSTFDKDLFTEVMYYDGPLNLMYSKFIKLQNLYNGIITAAKDKLAVVHKEDEPKDLHKAFLETHKQVAANR